ncbi:hypothetical protein C3B59_00960 [Cryobacterium zongtaii]|uniref:Uncharacterized protein n=1 Tax=Cryobacterium zongtaii TaxID=1259217 RepID=A0A2S3ZPQ6_9MICO|nr:hypothetical protein [Cryobacterium zongtaii]POH71208.1 hypothetical protein C3B59_00960 [Cryobacterium zongtaii]
MVDLNVDAAFVRGIASSMDRASAPLSLGGDLTRGAGSAARGSGPVASTLDESTIEWVSIPGTDESYFTDPIMEPGYEPSMVDVEGGEQ